MKAKMNNFRVWIDESRPDVLHGIYKKLLQESGFDVMSVQHHFFEPFGFTALYLLAESHFAIHTFPEENKTYIELTSCVDKPYERFITAFHALNINAKIIERTG